jgi:hypothetical protein
MLNMDDSEFFIIMLMQNIVLSPLSNYLIFFTLFILNLIYSKEQDLRIYFFESMKRLFKNSIIIICKKNHTFKYSTIDPWSRLKYTFNIICFELYLKHDVRNNLF